MVGDGDGGWGSHINYVQDVAGCKCNTNWTGLLIIIHWGHLLAYLTSLRLLCSCFSFRSTFSNLPAFFRLLSSFDPLVTFRFDRCRARNATFVDYYLLNAIAKTRPNEFKSSSFANRFATHGCGNIVCPACHVRSNFYLYRFSEWRLTNHDFVYFCIRLDLMPRDSSDDSVSCSEIVIR